MYNPNKKYGFIQNNKSSNKNKKEINQPFLKNINIPNHQNIINEPNLNEANLNFQRSESTTNDHAEYYSSDIDDPKYRPNALLYQDENFNNNIQTIIGDKNNLKYNNNINDDYLINDQNIFTKSKYHNFDSIENIDIPKENNFKNKTILDLQNENELLKQELLKKSETIKSKDELISEFQNIYNDLKVKFEQYELKNSQLRQNIKFLESQIKNQNQTLSKTQASNFSNPEMNEKTISQFKQQISDLESDYNTKTKKLVEKFKEKENKVKQDHLDEISRLDKNIENMRLENSKLKTEISNNKVEIDSLKAKLESKDYEKNTYLEQKDNEIIKLKEKIFEQERELEFKEKELKQRISKLEDQLSLMKQENNNLSNKLSESQEKFNEYESQINDQKNIINRSNNELNQVNLNIQNKDALIEQLKKQIEELNDVILQSEEDLKIFEENKQQEFNEYNNQIEILIQEKNTLRVQNMELTENLSLANENLKQLNDLIQERFADVEAELFKQTNINENMEKKYKDVLKHMKNKQNLLNEENNKLKEIINNQDNINENFGDNEIKMNKIQNLNLYKKINENNRNNNLDNLDFESPITTNRSSRNNNRQNLININENGEQTFGNNGLNIKNNENNFNNYNYNINSVYVDNKEERQRRNLNNFKMLLDKMEEKIQ